MHFVSITGQHEDGPLFEVAMGWHGPQANRLLLPKIRSDYGTYPLLDLLLVSKEFCTDAKFAFYSSMTLHCFGFEALKKMCNQKLLPGGIRQKKAPMMFSVDLVPRLILDIHGKVETKLRTLTSLWALARYSNNYLDLKLTFNGAIHVSERRMLSSTTYLQQLYAEIKSYQEQLRLAGVSGRRFLVSFVCLILRRPPLMDHAISMYFQLCTESKSSKSLSSASMNVYCVMFSLNVGDK